jgi:hypothetical protein
MAGREFVQLPEKLRDFRYFLWVVWDHLNLPDPTEIQYDIATFLQSQNIRRKVIQGFRGVGKSWIAAAYAIHQLRMNPQLNFLIVSASKSRADDFSTFTQRLVNEMPILQCLIPDSDQRNSKIAFDVSYAEADQAPSVKSIGITGQLSGNRADVIIADDIEVSNNSATQPMREKLAESIKEFDAIFKSQQDGEQRNPSGEQQKGSVIYLGTPQSDQSIYNLLPGRGYTVRIYPAQYPNWEQRAFYGDRLAPIIARRLKEEPSLIGAPTDPARFGTQELQERLASFGRSGYALQYMLDTSISDKYRYPLQIRDLIITTIDSDVGPEKIIHTNDPQYELKDLPCVGLAGDRYFAPLQTVGDMLPYAMSVMAIDPSGRGNNASSYCVCKQLNSQIFCMDVGGFLDGYGDNTLSALANIAKKYQVNYVVIESNFGDGMFKALIEPYFSRTYPVTIEEVRHSTQKEKRIIDTLEPVMNQHKLIMNRRVVENDYSLLHTNVSSDMAVKYMLMYQLSHLTRDRGSLALDDRVDILSIAVNYFTTAMNRDTERQMSKRKEEELQKALDVFLGRVSGGVKALVYDHLGKANIVSSTSRQPNSGYKL